MTFAQHIAAREAAQIPALAVYPDDERSTVIDQARACALNAAQSLSSAMKTGGSVEHAEKLLNEALATLGLIKQWGLKS